MAGANANRMAPSFAETAPEKPALWMRIKGGSAKAEKSGPDADIMKTPFPRKV